MNSPSLGNTIKKHPILASGALLLSAFIGAKVMHQMPLQDLEKRYLGALRENQYELDSLSKSYQRLNPMDTYVMLVGNDSFRVMNGNGETIFMLTCSDISGMTIDTIDDIPDNHVCLLRDKNVVSIDSLGVILNTKITTQSYITGSQLKLPFQKLHYLGSQKWQSI